MMAVVGQDDARRYGLLGLDPRRLVVTGAPAMDGLTGMRDQARGSRGRGVTIFGQGHTWVGARSAQRCDADAWCAELASLYALLCARWPDTPLRIKPHPAEPAHGTAELYTRAIPPALAGRVQVLSTDTANRELILDSELVISFSSSVWLEARILDRAAVFLSLQQRTGRTAAHIEAMGGTWLPGRALDFTARFTPRLDELAARAASRPPADEEILAAYAGPLDGRAAVRVADPGRGAAGLGAAGRGPAGSDLRRARRTAAAAAAAGQLRALRAPAGPGGGSDGRRRRAAVRARAGTRRLGPCGPPAAGVSLAAWRAARRSAAGTGAAGLVRRGGGARPCGPAACPTTRRPN
ncbi:MAG: hypothetical protein IPJ24_15900 [bacterium]|nr:hypothetical protein [bacterium]